MRVGCKKDKDALGVFKNLYLEWGKIIISFSLTCMNMNELTL